MTAAYPGAASTDSNLFIAVNNLSTSLVGSLTNSGDNTSGNGIQVNSTGGFPAVGFITIDLEVIAYTGVGTYLGNPVFTGITRAADGTSAASHSNSAPVQHYVIAAHHNSLKDEIKAVETDLVAAYGNVATATTIATALSLLLQKAGGTMTGNVTFPNTKGVVLTAPNATTWLLTIDNNGNLNITRQS